MNRPHSTTSYMTAAAVTLLLIPVLLQHSVQASQEPARHPRISARQPNRVLRRNRHVTKYGDEVLMWKNFQRQRTQPPHQHDNNDLDDVLVLTLVKDESSWGNGRSFSSYLSLLESFAYPVNKLSLGLLVSDRSTMLQMKEQISQYFASRLSPEHPAPALASVTLMHTSLDTGLDRRVRQHAEVQKKRRQLLSQLRNRLLYTALRCQDAVLWIDADVGVIPPDALLTMVKSKKDIIATWTVMQSGETYDLNTWKGSRVKPNEAEQKVIAAGGLFIPRHAPGCQFMDAFKDHPEEFVELDSVGGTVLFVRSEVHRSGLAFPPSYVVGTDWDHDGYDGIETEGLCYLAKAIGYKCWGATRLKAGHA